MGSLPGCQDQDDEELTTKFMLRPDLVNKYETRHLNNKVPRDLIFISKKIKRREGREERGMIVS